MIGEIEKAEKEINVGANEINDRAGQWRAILVVVIFVLAGVGFLFSEIFRIVNVDADRGVKEIVSNLANWPQSAVQKTEAGKKVEIPHQTAPKLPRLVGSMPDPARFGAAAVMIRDVSTGAVLFGKNQYESRPLASVSKLMTALVALDMGPNWTATTSVVSAEVSDKHLDSGGVYTLHEFWQASLVPSSNRAVLSLVQGLGIDQTDFVARMNAKARELGMMSTSFEEPTGLSENNLSTASDVVQLLSEALRHDEIRETLLMKSVTLGDGENAKKLISTDLILLGWIPTDFKFLGGKTGFTNAAGYNFTMRVENKAGRVVDVVVLGAMAHEDRFTEAKDAAEWAFRNYVWPDDPGYSSTTLNSR
ncbi:MAG TPA: serine hydrolase [Candidatus Magasanikbacteria bacterium]|nr:serine hydrolase [Candidatus Magasanikbacteria bacterium]